MDAVQAIVQGGVVLYPTRTLWGIGGDARQPGVIERVQALKGRAATSPFLMLVRDMEAVRALADPLPEAAERLMDALWPGELTLLLPAASTVPPALVGQEGLVGLRLATHPVAAALIEATGAWLVSTSANLTGTPAPLSLAEVPASIRAGVDAVAEGPPEPSGGASTVVAVDLTGRPRLIRAGAVSKSVLNDVLKGDLDG